MSLGPNWKCESWPRRWKAKNMIVMTTTMNVTIIEVKQMMMMMMIMMMGACELQSRR